MQPYYYGHGCVSFGCSFAWDNNVVSKAHELEQRLARTEQQLRLLQKISRFLVREMKLQDALDSVVSLVVEFMECDSCLLYLLDRNELVLRASNTPHPAAVGKVKLALNEGLTGWVAREKRLLAISREAYHDPRFKFFSDLPEDTFEAFLSAPVISRGGVEGVINVQHREPHPHTGFEMELLTTVGEQLGCLLMLSRMEAKPANESSDLVLSSGPQRVSSS
jgi:signal transduction protein with GAF and PtsI domain